MDCAKGRLEGGAGLTYTVQCDVQYSGTFVGTNSTWSGLEDCTKACTAVPEQRCVAVSKINDLCTLLGYNATYSSVQGGRAAFNSDISGPPMDGTVAQTTPTSSTSSASISTSGPASTTNENAASAIESKASATGQASKSSSTGISAGAIAGAAVGAAIFGAAIALLIAFCLWGRKRRNQKGTAFVSEKALPQHPWDAYLPHSADDQTISRSAQTLFSQIDLHVENYYGNIATTGLSDVVNENLAKVNSGELPSHVKAMLVETTTPLPIIKHSFAWYILSKLTPSVSGEDSLLPAEFARLPPKLGGSGAGNKSGARAREDYGKSRPACIVKFC